MADHASTRSFPTRALLDVLRPLLRKLQAERTISSGKLGILRYLADHEKATTSELALAIHVSPQGISLAARELLTLNFVERTPDEHDRRKVWLHLTETGRQKLADEQTAGNMWFDKAVSEQLTHREREILEAAIPVLAKLGMENPHE
jgi:DNA-binding MarR family transcriptional regulator